MKLFSNQVEEIIHCVMSVIFYIKRLQTSCDTSKSIMVFICVISFQSYNFEIFILQSLSFS